MRRMRSTPRDGWAEKVEAEEAEEAEVVAEAEAVLDGDSGTEEAAEADGEKA